jgi:hypothetical protein
MLTGFYGYSRQIWGVEGGGVGVLFKLDPDILVLNFGNIVRIQYIVICDVRKTVSV